MYCSSNGPHETVKSWLNYHVHKPALVFAFLCVREQYCLELSRDERPLDLAGTKFSELFLAYLTHAVFIKLNENNRKANFETCPCSLT